MANRTWNSPRALEKELITLAFQFALGTDASVTSGSSLGRGIASVVKTSTGLYTVTLQDPFVALIAGNVSLQAAAAATLVIRAQFGDFNIAGAASSAAVVGVSSVGSQALQTVQVRTVDSNGAVADTTVACKVFAHLMLRNSQVV